MNDIRKAATERAARTRTTPVGASFESERQRAKNALVKQLDSLDGKNIGEIVDGIFVGLPGYKVKITGGSDKNGTPMRKDLPGKKRVSLLLADGLGFHERYHGERKRVAARGSAISSEIVQINMVVAEYGPKPIEELLNGGEEKTE